MVELREKQVEKIKNAEEIKSVESIIDTFILEMSEKGIEDFRIASFIRRLDIALVMIERRELTDKQWENVKSAQKILMNKIINENKQAFVKSN